MLERSEVRTNQNIKEKQGSEGNLQTEKVIFKLGQKTERKQVSKGHSLSKEYKGQDWLADRKKASKKHSHSRKDRG